MSSVLNTSTMKSPPLEVWVAVSGVGGMVSAAASCGPGGSAFDRSAGMPAIGVLAAAGRVASAAAPASVAPFRKLRRAGSVVELRFWHDFPPGERCRRIFVGRGLLSASMPSLAPPRRCVKRRQTHVMGDGSGNATRPLLLGTGFKLRQHYCSARPSRRGSRRSGQREVGVMTPGRSHLSVVDARALAEGALRGIGYDADEARIIADHVIDAALCGYEYSGLAKILNIAESEHFKLQRRPMKVLRETDVSLALDGGNNVGMLALFHAAEATIKKTAAHGIALVSVTNAWMIGRSAYYVEMIANAGLVAIHTAASSRLVAPPGGVAAALGTNPIAIAVPSSRGPIVLDMGTSAYMMTEVMLRERLGELLPEGVAIGPGGKPTRDPTAARRGALLPFGGYKGFGLALMMQALGLLGGAESEYGYLFVAFRPDLLGPADVFERQVTQLIERIKATPRQPGIDEIRIPSERAFRSRERARREGLEIDRMVFDALVALRARQG